VAEHRVPMLGASRRFPDPETSTDPGVQGVLTALRTLEIAPPPRAHFRAELRAQLVAVTPRLVVEGTPELIKHTAESLASAEATAEPSGLRAVGDRLRGLRLGKPLAIVTGAFAVLALLLGGAVWMSKDTVPGDALYGLKRASENAELGMTSGTTDRSKTLLKFAKNRTNEVLQLLGQPTAMALTDGPNAAGGVSASTASLIRDTLGSADDDLRQASKLLGTQSVRSDSAKPLNVLTSWGPGQTKRFDRIVEHVPAGSLHDRAVASADLLDRALARAAALQTMAGCSSLDTASSDDLGPVPPNLCEPAPVAPGGPSAPASGPSGSATNKPAKPNTGTEAPATSVPQVGGGTGTQGPAAPGGRSTPATTEPNAPSLTPSVPAKPTNPLGGPTSGVGAVVDGVVSGVGGAVSGGASGVGAVVDGVLDGVTGAVGGLLNPSPAAGATTSTTNPGLVCGLLGAVLCKP